jgi:glycerol-3-phosphate dehydrogenase (NAD(P)+)
MLKVSIYGIGNFGFALLKHLSQPYAYTREFILFAYDSDKLLMDNLRINRTHLIHHRDVKISKHVILPTTLKQLLDNTDVLILAVTSIGIKDVLLELRPFINSKLIIVNTAKALSAEGRRFSEVIFECMDGIDFPVSIAVLAGGTIAYDLFKHEPLGVDIASYDEKTLKLLKDIFSTNNLKVYTSTDLVGVEYAASFKNVISILAGIVKGLGLSYGSQTYMISRAADEVKRLVIDEFGAKENTFGIGSQCWGNDLWMSCTGNTRNREFGILLGKGKTVNEAINEMRADNKTIEGINTLMTLNNIIKTFNNKYPIMQKANEIIQGRAPAKESIIDMLKSDKV